MNDFRAPIDLAKAKLPLPSLLAMLNLTEHAKKSARCPIHRDRSPSFSVFHGTKKWRWKCHAGCGEGDEINFLEAYLRTTSANAIRIFLEMASGSSAPAPPPPSPKRVEQASGPILPSDATQGTLADWQELAALRRVGTIAPATAAQHLRTLFFGTVRSFRCWILTDERRLCAEARRMDGKQFPAIGELGERKAHTIRGSVKSWPVGLAVRGFTPADFRALLTVEGGPDYLTALHFTLLAQADCLPIAMLGAGVGSVLHPEAIPLVHGQRVRFYPHADKCGTDAVEKWARQFQNAGATFDAFKFAGLRMTDGSALNDFNDCTRIHPEDAHELAEVLP